MPRIPTPLTWKCRNFAFFEPDFMVKRLYAVVIGPNCKRCGTSMSAPEAAIVDR